ncbi:Lcl3 protein [Pichia kluyveri]|uniref:Probable endonuclease LCL3 n=1 Tax=Pichia kluyveri TaxID=36015 RepID=A0AAV5R483_PICKL|nr:Lcl3 protein [Pichia kluyveri]
MSREVTLYHPLVLLYGLGTSVTIIGGYSLYHRYFRRIKRAIEIPSYYFRKRFIYGKVTSVGDGDNFHLYHLPGGFLSGWGWLRKVPEINRFKELKGETIAVRICGADAPERAHFGRPAQPFSEEALIWLRQYILGRWLYIKPLHLDQYQRVVAKVLVLKWTGFKDVSEEMIKIGLATVYEAKAGAEFDGKESIYRKRQTKAQKKKLGMWSLNKKDLQTPREYKNKYNN